MSPINVLLAQSRHDVLAEAIADALHSDGDFELVGHEVAMIEGVESLLDASRVDVLVVVGDVDALMIDGLLRRRSGIVVSHISIGSNAVRFDLKDLGLDQLLSTLRALARSPQSAPPRAVEFELAPCAPGPSEKRFSLTPVEPARDETIAAALNWAIEALCHFSARRPLGEGDVPGMARNPDSLSAMLRDGDAAADHAPVADAEAALLAALAANDESSLRKLNDALRLTFLEIKLLALCLAPELDPKFHAAYGVLNDDMGRRAPTLGLACAALGEPAAIRRELCRSGNLWRWRLLDCGRREPHAEDLLRLDPAALGFALGRDKALLDDDLIAGLTAAPWRGANLMRRPADIADSHDLATELAGKAHWIALTGDGASAQRATLERAAQEAGLALLRVSLPALAALGPAEQAEATTRLARAARLQLSALAVDATGAGVETVPALATLAAAIGDAGRPSIIVTPSLGRFVGALPARDLFVVQRDEKDLGGATAFQSAAADSGLAITSEEAERLSAGFSLPLEAIEDAARLAALKGAARQPADRHHALFSATCRSIASPDLPRFAERAPSAISLDDVVLPDVWRAELRELIGHVVNAPKVMNGWGFGARQRLGRGVAALFCGASGTGKTMAAQAIAGELEAETFVVDLSRIVSKYIGETEKNLDVVFGDAERANAVLVFDEADAICGKRSEVKDAHDRYANIEVAYLLQRIEAYSGLVVLTTNFRQNLDQAFMRRLRFVVEFPKPDADARRDIWERHLPASAPRAADVDLDFLARRIEITGGAIRQITLRAAFAAAGEGAPAIAMRHLVSAARAELVKLGQPIAVRQFDEFELARLKYAPRAA